MQWNHESWYLEAQSHEDSEAGQVVALARGVRIIGAHMKAAFCWPAAPFLWSFPVDTEVLYTLNSRL